MAELRKFSAEATLKAMHARGHSGTSIARALGRDLIAADPAIFGLDDLVLRDKERIQPRAGRLDLLLQDAEKRR